MMNMKKLSIVLAVFCIGLFTHVRAQVPHVVVEQTVQKLVNYGVKKTPELVRAVTRYYVQVARTSKNLREIADDDFILQHTHTFMTMHKELLSAKAIKHVQQQLGTPPCGGTRVEAKILEQVRKTSFPAEVEISVPEHMRTGEQLIRHFIPDWRQQLFGPFTKKEQDIIWQAVLKTDSWFFEQGENGQVIFMGEGWDYLGQFAIELRLLLNEQGLQFTPLQWKRLLEVQRYANASLPLVFKLASAECFVAVHGKLPIRETDNPEEYSLATTISHLKTNGDKGNPLAKQIIAFANEHRLGKVPQKRWEELLQFWQEYNRLPVAHASSKKEDSLARAISRLIHKGNRNNLYVQQIIQFVNEHRVRAERRTSQQWWEELERFWNKWQRLPSRTSEDLDEQSLAQAVARIRYSKPLEDEDPYVRQIRTFMQDHRTWKTPEEWWFKLKEFYKEYHRLPSLRAHDRQEQELARGISNVKANSNQSDEFVRRIHRFTRQFNRRSSQPMPLPTEELFRQAEHLY